MEGDRANNPDERKEEKPDKSPLFGSYHSPFSIYNANDGMKNGFSIHSNVRGSFHNYFGRSPQNPDMAGNCTPLQNLLNSQHGSNSPNFHNQNSPNFANGINDFLEFAGIEHDYKSEDRNSVMSSLSYESYWPPRDNNNNQTLKAANGGTTILDKNLEVVSGKEMTMENVNPGKPGNMFDDLGSNPVKQDSFTGITIEKPQIAGEMDKEVSSSAAF